MTSNDGTDERDVTLDVLLAEHAATREDERSMLTIFGTILSVALGLVAALSALLFGTCPQGSDACSSNASLTPVPVWAYLGAPALPTALLAYALVLASVQTLRSYYLRALELRILQRTSDQLGGPEEVPFPTWSHLTLDITGQTGARPLNRVNWVLMYGLVGVMLGAFLFVSVTRIDIPRYRVLAVVIDVALLAVPVFIGFGNASNGRQLWHDAQQGLAPRLQRTGAGFPPTPRTGERSLGSFLLLPRYQEELLKALLIPVTALVMAPIVPTIRSLDAGWVWTAVVFWLTFELLVYQARYLYNDVRDRKVDAESLTYKRRFPASKVDNPRALTAALMAFLARSCVAVIVVLCILPLDDWQWAWELGFLGAIAATAMAYETVRNRCIRAASKDPTDELAKRRRDCYARWLVALVGLGYGLRIVVGAWLAGVRPGWSEDALLILALLAVGGSMFGTTFVSATWALESTRAPDAGAFQRKAHLQYFRERLMSWGTALPVGPDRRILRPSIQPTAPYFVSSVLATVTLLAAWYVAAEHGATKTMVLVVGSVALGTAAIAAGFVALARAKIVLLVLGTVVFAVLATSADLDGATIFSGVTLGAVTVVTLAVFRAMRWEDLPDLDKKVAASIYALKSGIEAWFGQTRSHPDNAPPHHSTVVPNTPYPVDTRASTLEDGLQLLFPESDPGERVAPHAVALIVDVEGTLVDWRPTVEEIEERMEAIRGMVPTGCDIIFVSNGKPPKESPEFDSIYWRAGKPHFDLPARLCDTTNLTIVGDQPLTDGRLADRLGASFVLVDLPDGAPRWPRLQRAVGNRLRRFRGSSGSNGPGTQDSATSCCS